MRNVPTLVELPQPVGNPVEPRTEAVVEVSLPQEQTYVLACLTDPTTTTNTAYNATAIEVGSAG